MWLFFFLFSLTFFCFRVRVQTCSNSSWIVANVAITTYPDGGFRVPEVKEGKEALKLSPAFFFSLLFFHVGKAIEDGRGGGAREEQRTNERTNLDLFEHQQNVWLRERGEMRSALAHLP